MKIKPFAVEEWMNEYEVGAKYNIAETCVDSVSIDELVALAGVDRDEFIDSLCSKKLTYGDILGFPEFKEGICPLYKTIEVDEIVTTHGAAGANHHVFYSLIEPGDKIISITPTYQQLYSIPESFGAVVSLMHLEQSNGYLPDIDELRALADSETKMICINNPNNPTGALMDQAYLQEIVEIAKTCDAYIMCDETYRHLTQTDEWTPSIVDMYDKGISVSSMSKVFSLAGIRIGWIATHDKEAMNQFITHRDYNHISCGMFDERIASLALRYKDKLLERNRGIIRENLAILDAWVEQEPLVHYTKPEAGTTALVYYDLPVDSYELCKGMYHGTGAFVTPGDCFDEPYSMRIGYACDKETLESGLKALSEYLHSVQG